MDNYPNSWQTLLIENALESWLSFISIAGKVSKAKKLYFI